LEVAALDDDSDGDGDADVNEDVIEVVTML
jgi:hypothetical protein